MAEPLRCVPADRIVAGWDFSTGAVKCLAFDLDGNTLAEVRLPTDLWTEGGVSELNLMQLEGQAMASLRAPGGAAAARSGQRQWVAGGISATHHTAGRIDANAVQVRRAICWNDHSLAAVSRPRPGTPRRTGESHPGHRRTVGDPLHAQPSRQGRGMSAAGGLETHRTACCRTARWRRAS